MLSISDSRLLAFERTSCDGEQRVVVLANLSNQQVILPLPNGPGERLDLLSGERTHGSTCTLGAYQAAWLV